MARDRAIRFLDPTLSPPGGSRGMEVTSGGRLAMAEGDDAVRQAILLLLSTRPGERVMRPTYGCHLNRLVFAPNDATTAGLAIHYVRDAIVRWEPRAEILSLDAGPDADNPSQLTIVLTYRVRSTGSVTTVEYPVDLDDTGGAQ